MGGIVLLHLLVIWAIRRRGPQGSGLILAGGRRGDGGNYDYEHDYEHGDETGMAMRMREGAVAS
jgi:hypothetical protein